MIVTGEAVGRWVVEKTGGNWTDHCQAIGQTHKGRLIVGVMFDMYTQSSIAIHSRCDDPAHVTGRFYWTIFDYPFNQLGVKRLTGIVCASNKRAQQVNEKLGFVREATLSDYFPEGDAIIYIMRRENCRWLALEKKYGRQVITSSGP